MSFTHPFRLFVSKEFLVIFVTREHETPNAVPLEASQMLYINVGAILFVSVQSRRELPQVPFREVDPPPGWQFIFVMI